MDVLQLIKTKSVIYETISMAAGRLAQGHMGYYEVTEWLWNTSVLSNNPFIFLKCQLSQQRTFQGILTINAVHFIVLLWSFAFGLEASCPFKARAPSDFWAKWILTAASKRQKIAD